MTFAWRAAVVVCAALLSACATSEEKSTSPLVHTGNTGPMERPPTVERVRMETTAGDIVIELDRAKAPVSVTNFLGYVERGEYNGTIFHRVIENFVVQGGGYSADFKELPSRGVIRNEWQNGLKNVRGTIAMARDAAPDTATREFYINVADNAKLDTAREMTGNAGYAVFGHVVEGMSVVDKIRKGATTTRGEMENVPVEPVVVVRMEVVK
jgi:peptidyl-prolyl cis-trans isomerase A (cyclophilin A)